MSVPTSLFISNLLAAKTQTVNDEIMRTSPHTKPEYGKTFDRRRLPVQS